MAGWLTGTLPNYSGLSGIESMEADTGLPGGSAPQSVKLNLNQLSPANCPRNLLDGGDFTTNPWQRGTTFTGIANTLTYTADRFFAYGAATSSISVSKQAISAGSLNGFGSAMQFGRASANSDVNPIYFGQVVETGDSIRVAGQNLCLSFYAEAGANFSPIGGTLNVTVYGGTGTNQSAANMLSGSWSGQKTLYSGSVSVLNTAWGTQYVVNNGGAGIAVPNNITQLGVVFSYTPVGTAGANDWVQITGAQLEQGIYPSLFEHRDIQLELEIAQRYCWVLNEPAANVIVGSGMNTTTAIQIFYIALPTPMVKAPTVTVVTAGTFKTNQASTATATTVSAGTTHTPNAISINGNSTGTAGQATLLMGGGGSGQVVASADF